MSLDNSPNADANANVGNASSTPHPLSNSTDNSNREPLRLPHSVPDAAQTLEELRVALRTLVQTPGTQAKSDVLETLQKIAGISLRGLNIGTSVLPNSADSPAHSLLQVVSTSAPSITLKDALEFLTPKSFSGKAEDVETFIGQWGVVYSLPACASLTDWEKIAYFSSPRFFDVVPSKWQQDVRVDAADILSDWSQYLQWFRGRFQVDGVETRRLSFWRRVLLELFIWVIGKLNTRTRNHLFTRFRRLQEDMQQSSSV